MAQHDTKNSGSEKRKLNDSSVTSNFVELVRGDPWLEDGNIILQAQSTQFKVLRSILAKNSEVFRDMFELPQESDACPTVALLDSAIELGHLLRAVFDRT